jgi:hypothetical protein
MLDIIERRHPEIRALPRIIQAAVGTDLRGASFSLLDLMMRPFANFCTKKTNNDNSNSKSSISSSNSSISGSSSSSSDIIITFSSNRSGIWALGPLAPLHLGPWTLDPWTLDPVNPWARLDPSDPPGCSPTPPRFSSSDSNPPTSTFLPNPDPWTVDPWTVGPLTRGLFFLDPCGPTTATTTTAATDGDDDDDDGKRSDDDVNDCGDDDPSTRL